METGKDTGKEQAPGPARVSPGLSSSPKEMESPLPGSAKAELSVNLSNLSTSPSLPTSGPLSPHAQDRVFPVRSVVSVDPKATPMARSETGDSFPGMSTPTPTDPYDALQRRYTARRQSNTSLPSTDPGSEQSDTARSQPRDTSRPGVSGRSREQSLWSRGAGATPSNLAGENQERSRMPRQLRFPTDDVASLRSTTSEVASEKHSRSPSLRSTDGGGPLMTARFKHIMTDGGHLVVTGRDGETLQRCEDEPIHIPGAVQDFGLLIAFREEADGKLSVRVVSENSVRIIGYSPRQLFALESLSDVLSEEQTVNLIDHLDFIKEADSDPVNDGPEVFTLSIRHPKTRRLRKLWCAMHTAPSDPGLVICELELEEDPDFPLVPSDAETPEPPEDTLQSNPTAEELAQSTHNMSRPLRILRTARKKKGEAAAMEVFNIMSQVQEQLAGAPDLQTFLKVLVGVTKELTGFHRVMIYQFDSAWNGKVVTELVDPRATKDLYMGLNFPASDIPSQARELYKVNKVRLLYDRDQETARLVCRTHEDLEQPVDLTFSYLRAMSPIHIKYLKNMAVRSSMSISINAFDQLWGLISCHSYGSKGMRVAFPIRKMCRLVGDSASRNIERLSYASRLQARKLINTVPTEKNPSGYIIASSEDLLTLFDADYGILSIRDETKILGNLDATQEALALLEYFRMRQPATVMTVQDIRTDLPDLRYPPGFQVLAGLLLVPLSSTGNDFIVFFRRGQREEVKWAGNPYEKFLREGTEGYLEPRKSFKTWSETVVGRCREWTEEQIETASVLCLVYGKFIEVWRQKEVAVHNSQLHRLLLANSAHEVRTPLNAIINYLEIALEGSLDPETRDNLSKSHSASKSLIYVINDLLDLTKTEEGRHLVRGETFDLPQTVQEATDMFVNDAKRKNLDFGVEHKPGVPQMVLGDQRRVRQAISNVVANAMQHTSAGSVRVETWLVHQEGNQAEVDIAVQDTGVGMSSKKLDDLFRALEQVHTSERLETPPESATSEGSAIAQKKDGALGLGLAFVSRIVRNMNGQLLLKSEEGKGSRFVIQLRFELPESTSRPMPKQPEGLRSTRSMDFSAEHTPRTPPVPEGEVMLVRHDSGEVTKPVTPTRPTGQLSRQNSKDSAHSAHSATSLKSFKSGSSAKSEAGRLIDAMQETTMIGSIHGSMAVSPGPESSRRPKSATSASGMGSPGPIRHGSVSSPSTVEAAHGAARSKAGEAKVTDQATPVKPVRVLAIGEPVGHAAPSTPNRKSAGRTSFNISSAGSGSSSSAEPIAPTKSEGLRVLVAEDDPINSKIIQKRLGKAGHHVHLTVNGEECAMAQGAEGTCFDVVLMDMQMPIVDGLTSTKMIRSHEKSLGAEYQAQAAALGAKWQGRIPIFAVSASLVEAERSRYTDAGFDAWILKPIDFKRLNTLLAAITDQGVREACAYVPGKWEQGGWFYTKQPDATDADTRPDFKKDVGERPERPGAQSMPRHEGDPISEEQQRLERRPSKRDTKEKAGESSSAGAGGS